MYRHNVMNEECHVTAMDANDGWQDGWQDDWQDDWQMVGRLVVADGWQCQPTLAKSDDFDKYIVPVALIGIKLFYQEDFTLLTPRTLVRSIQYLTIKLSKMFEDEEDGSK